MASKPKKKPKAIGVDGREIFDMDCATCMKANIKTEGMFHCKYCGVLCENCASKHQKTPKHKGHWAMRLKTVVQTVPKSEFKSLTNCEIHTHEKITGYCIDDGELFCNTCLSEMHTECSTETLENMSANMSRIKDVRDGRLELEDLRRRTRKAGKDKRKEMQYLSKQADEFVDKVLRIREKINKMLDNMVDIIVKDKTAFCYTEADIIENHVHKCKQLDPLFDDAKTKLDEAYQKGTDVEVWVALNKLQRLITTLDGVVTKIENDKCDVKFEFCPSSSLAAMLREPENVGKMRVITSRVMGEKTEVVSKMDEVKKKRFRPPWMKPDEKERWDSGPHLKPISKGHGLGKSIEIVPPPTDEETNQEELIANGPKAKRGKGKGRRNKYSLTEDMEQRGPMFGETKKVKLTLLGTKEIVIPEETTENCITGSTYLPNGRLVFVDYNNKNLKLFTSDFELLRCKFVEERPWDVTSCYSTVIAISYPFVNSIDILETNTDLKVEGTIKTDRKCHGVAFHTTERWLYVACGEGLGARLQAYSLDGYIRKMIVPLPGVLHEPCFLTITPDNTKVFISDLDNGVVGFDTKSGELICQYRDAKIKRYWDLTVDAGGRVLILTTDPDCLYIIMGDHNGQLLSSFKGKEKVCSVCYDKATKNLIVSRWKTDEVEAFRLVHS